MAILNVTALLLCAGVTGCGATTDCGSLSREQVIAISKEHVAEYVPVDQMSFAIEEWPTEYLVKTKFTRLMPGSRPTISVSKKDCKAVVVAWS